MKISEEIAETLRDEIIAGVYKPRQRLIEEELSDRFFVSRTPIREALKELESAGLIAIEPYKGAFVADRNPSEIRDIYELRSVLEGVYHGARGASYYGGDHSPDAADHRPHGGVYRRR